MPSLSAATAASASGLNAERARIEVAVSNLANAESTGSASGTPYRRRDVVLAADGVTPFEGTLQTAGARPASRSQRSRRSRAFQAPL
jgi:flagellar basal-body rod protein FlgC